MADERWELLQQEYNFDAPFGFNSSNVCICDLFLWRDRLNYGKYRLVVRVNLQFRFKNGVDKSTGGELTWTDGEKLLYATKCKAVIENIWNNNHPIIGESVFGAERMEVKVEYVVKYYIDANIDAHWTLAVTKAANAADIRDHVNAPRQFLWWKWKGDDGGGNVILDNFADQSNRNFMGKNQRTIAHEFGHMMGYRDEYPDSATFPAGPLKPAYDGANPHHLSDTDALMSGGEAFRERYYAILAYWLNQRNLKDPEGHKYTFKVDGRVTVETAQL